MARSYPLDINVTQNLGQSPKARKALHNDPDEKVYHDFSDQDKNVLEEACDSLGDVFECHLIVRDHIKDHLRGEETIHSWDKYFEETCKGSYAFLDLIMAVHFCRLDKRYAKAQSRDLFFGRALALAH